MNILAILVGVLSIIIVLLVAYIIYLQFQLRDINKQLSKRLAEHTRQPIRLELINRELTTLAVNINKCLKAEENLRLESIREEKRFKEIISHLSHDLRTPLTAIMGYQQLLARSQLTADQQEKLQIAQKHANELESLIHHFFEYSNLISADQRIQIERMNLTNLVMECLAESVLHFEEKEQMIHFEEEGPIFIAADKELTIRIIRNLIRNCIVHSPGDVCVRVFSRDRAIVSFKNPVEKTASIDLERIFDRFYTADKARSKSTGLGLHIVKLLAEQMGGSTGATIEDDHIDIWVEFQLWN